MGWGFWQNEISFLKWDLQSDKRRPERSRRVASVVYGYKDVIAQSCKRCPERSRWVVSGMQSNGETCE